MIGLPGKKNIIEGSLAMKEKLRKINEDISYYIRPATFPLAIKMLEDVEAGEALGKRPSRDMGINVLLCQAFGISRRQGSSLLLALEDIVCPSALFYFGLAQAPESYWQGKIAFAPYNQTEEARACRSRSLPFFPQDRYKGLLVTPLFKAGFEPDVILVYGQPAQMMRFVQAAVFKTGDSLKFSAQGGGSCAFEVVKPLLTGEAGLVLPGNGERIFGLTQDDEMVFAIPWHHVDEIVAGLRKTHEGGQRYPVPAYGAYTPSLPPDYTALLKSVKKEG